MKQVSSILVIVLSAVWVNAQLLSQLKLCSRSDPNFKECLKDAIPKGMALLGAGVPEFNIPPIDPITLDKWVVPQKPPLDFPQTYTNIEIHGHITGEVQDVDVTLTDKTFFLKMKLWCPEIDFKADYVYENAIINGADYSSKGKSSTRGFNFTLNVEMKGDIIRKDGDDYLSITSVKVESLGIGDLKFNIQADKPDVGNKLAKLFTDNWRDMITESKTKYTEIYAEAYKKEANAFFSQFPINQVFLK